MDSSTKPIAAAWDPVGGRPVWVEPPASVLSAEEVAAIKADLAIAAQPPSADGKLLGTYRIVHEHAPALLRSHAALSAELADASVRASWWAERAGKNAAEVSRLRESLNGAISDVMRRANDLDAAAAEVSRLTRAVATYEAAVESDKAERTRWKAWLLEQERAGEARGHLDY